MKNEDVFWVEDVTGMPVAIPWKNIQKALTDSNVTIFGLTLPLLNRAIKEADRYGRGWRRNEEILEDGTVRRHALTPVDGQCDHGGQE